MQTGFRPLVNQRNDTIVYTNSFWNQYFSVNQSDLRDRKERIHKLFIGLRWWPTCLLQNTAQPEKRDIFMKWERGLLALRTPIPSLLQSAASAMGQFISLRNDMTFSDIWNNTTSNISKLSKIPRAGTVIFENQAHGNIPHFNRWAFYFKLYTLRKSSLTAL